MRQGADPARDTHVFVKMGCPVARRIRQGQLQYLIMADGMKDLVMEDFLKHSTNKELELVTNDKIKFYTLDSGCEIGFLRWVFDCPGPGHPNDFRAKLLKAIAGCDGNEPEESVAKEEPRESESKMNEKFIDAVNLAPRAVNIDTSFWEESLDLFKNMEEGEELSMQE